jgi:hypothetical protein
VSLYARAKIDEDFAGLEYTVRIGELLDPSDFSGKGRTESPLVPNMEWCYTGLMMLRCAMRFQ